MVGVPNDLASPVLAVAAQLPSDVSQLPSASARPILLVDWHFNGAGGSPPGWGAVQGPFVLQAVQGSAAQADPVMDEPSVERERAALLTFLPLSGLPDTITVQTQPRAPRCESLRMQYSMGQLTRELGAGDL